MTNQSIEQKQLKYYRLMLEIFNMDVIEEMMLNEKDTADMV